jgi:tol-pal system protein YbgF
MALLASRTSQLGLFVASALAAPLGVGCASASPPSPAPIVATAGGEVDDVTARVETLETEAQRRERRIRELESRLALADAEVRDLRDEAADRQDREEELRTREVVRIGEGADRRGVAATVEPVELEQEAEPEDEGPRPVLRLYGVPTPPALAYDPGGSSLPSMTDPGIARPMPASTMPTYLAAPPAGMLGRLPVVAIPGSSGVPPIPDRPLTVMPGPSAGPALAARPSGHRTADDPVVREYQAALGHVAGRRFDEALASLGAFLRSHPQHPYADNALYWRGEVLYATRDYVAAERELLEMVRRFPRGNKVPDALLRLGFCRQRQGDVEGARAYFRRVRAEHPGTVAARLASREDT